MKRCKIKVCKMYHLPCSQLCISRRDFVVLWCRILLEYRAAETVWSHFCFLCADQSLTSAIVTAKRYLSVEWRRAQPFFSSRRISLSKRRDPRTVWLPVECRASLRWFHMFQWIVHISFKRLAAHRFPVRRDLIVWYLSVFVIWDKLAYKSESKKI